MWNDLKSKPEYKLKQEENKISYGWDSIIDQAYTSNNPEYEKIAREMARVSRFERRILAKGFYEAGVKAQNDKNNIYKRVGDINGVTYAFLFLDDKFSISQREEILEKFCYAYRGKFKNNRKVIGIATEKRTISTRSYSFRLCNIPEWTEEDELQVKKNQKDTGILTTSSMTKCNALI